MKRKILIILSAILILIGVLSACAKKTYKIDFIADGEIYHTVNANSEEGIKLPADPEKDGHVFEGWFLDKDVWNEQFTEGMKINKDTAVYAKFTPEQGQEQEYTITFNSNGGSAVAPITKKAGESVSAPTPPTKEGYTFDGWYTDNGIFAVSYTFGVMPSQNITLYAKWSETPPAGPLYTRINYDGTPDEEGDYILFGEFPQSLKADSVTISATQDVRGYYLGSDGYYYAKLTATPHNSFVQFYNSEQILTGEVYYFKVEPIKWRILSENDGTAFILCETILISKRFDDDSNDYADSEIRAWLNNQFYETAFSVLARQLIQLTEVDNSSDSTAYTDNQYACENTNDKIFLPSHQEITTTDYGFKADNINDSIRRISVSDYSLATGAYVFQSKGYWWLRSPDYYYPDQTSYVDHTGTAHLLRRVENTLPGVVPALYINLD